MRIHIPGDWAAVWAFGLASVFLFLGISTHFLDVSLAAFPKQTAPLMVLSYVLVGVYAVIAVICAVAAIRGREIPDGSDWRYSDGVGMDVRGIIASAIFLIIGGASIVFLYEAPIGLKDIFLHLLFAAFWLYPAFVLVTRARITVFSSDKQFIVLTGKPIVFSRKIYPISEMNALELSRKAYKDNYGNITITYGILGVSGDDSVELTYSTPKTLRADVAEMMKITGLSAPRFPDADQLEREIQDMDEAY